MDPLHQLIARFPKFTILAVLAATLLVSLPIRWLRLETDVEAMMPQRHPLFLYNKKVEEIFGTDKLIIVGVVNEGPSGIFNPDTLELVERLSLEIEGLEGIVGEDVVSLQTLDNIVGSEFGLEVVRLMESAPDAAEGAAELRSAVFENDMFISNVVSPDGEATAIFAELEEGYDKVEMYHRIKQIIADDFDPGENRIIIAGKPVIEGTLGRYALEDMRNTLPLVLLVSIVALYLTLRSARGTILPLVVVIATVLWTMGIMSLVGIPLYAMTTLAPVLLMAIGLAYGIHIINRYYEKAASASDGDRRRVVVDTMHEMWPPVTMASLTTAAGFFSLVTSDMMPVRYFGIFTGIGVLSALVFSLTFIPAWLVLLPLRGRRGAPSRSATEGEGADSGLLARLLLGVGRVVAGYPARVAAVAAAIIVIGLLCLVGVRVDGSLLSNFEPGSEVLLADALLNERFGGTNTLDVVVDGEKTDDMKSPEVLRAIDGLQADLEGMEEVGASFSIADYLKRMNRVMNEDRRDFARIPDSRELVAQYLLLYSFSGDPDDFEDVVDFDYRRANARIRIHSDHSAILGKVIARAQSSAAELFAGLPVEIHLAGNAMTSFTFVGLIVRGQILSIIVAIALVFLITSLMFRSAVAGLFCITPVGIATMLNFSLMGATGIPLSVTTALLSGMGIGIGVDYAIHFVARYRVLSRTESDHRRRVQRTIGTTGRAILFNAVVVTAGFLVLMISNFPPSRWLSALVSVNMLACFLGAMTFLPACLVLLKPSFAERRRASRNSSSAAAC
jgi:hydrophobe/amphiphile efflux-3 (HAE3) family protein